MDASNEIILYQPDDAVKIEVRLDAETVWLSLNQMSELFDRDKSVISRHISAIYNEGELDRNSTVAKNATVQIENGRSVIRQIDYYNLDVIISVGYRVKSVRGTRFRQWANRVLKEYLLRGYSINQRFERLERRVAETENKIEFFVHTSLPPVEGVFFDGKIFDAYKFASDLIRSAKERIILIDNYVDDTVLQMLDKRQDNVVASIYTKEINAKLKLDVQKHNAQYRPIDIHQFADSHDRFLLIDDNVYLIGASLKDLGKKMFAFSKITFDIDEMLKKLNEQTI